MNSSKVEAYLSCFSDLSSGLAGLSGHLDAGFLFTDPFHSAAPAKTFLHVLGKAVRELSDPRFEIEALAQSEASTMITWKFLYHRSPNSTEVETMLGASRIDWSPEGKVLRHIDYWDAAGQVYEKLPYLGRLFALLRRSVTQWSLR